MKYYNNIVDQDHRCVKRLVRPSMSFKSLATARATISGNEAVTMIGKGQVKNVGGRDMKAQAKLVAELFEVAA